MSGSPRSEQFDDIYFAVEDGLEETKHVFLAGNGLPGRWEGHDNFTIAETGFGTGLNFLSAWECFERTAAPHQKLNFISFEKYPLSAAQIAEYLAHWTPQIGPYLKRLVEVYPARVTGWHKIHVTDRVTLLLIFDEVNRALPELDHPVDAWFLDGHAPAKNPDMWSDLVFASMRRLSAPGATIATFTAAGIVKRGLASAGFKVTKCRGFGRKRDMLTGVQMEGTNTREKPQVRSVAVIGGGLAGTAAAYTLKQAGLAVTIFEKVQLAEGASGNPVGLFNPRFSAKRSVDSDLYGSAYALALRTFKTIDDIGYAPSGSLHLVTDEEKAAKFSALLENWGWHPDHLVQLDAAQASEVAGVPVPVAALYLPDAGSVSPQKLCAAYAKDIAVRNEEVDSLTSIENKWDVNGSPFDAVVIANGAECLKFSQTKDLPVATVRGQISFAPATAVTEKLKANLCYGGYCSPGIAGRHVIGSTFQPWLTETSLRDEDHGRIIAGLEEAVPALAGEMKVDGGRAALRVAAKNRAPIGGQVGPEFPHLYISTAHGSHGLLTSLVIAEQIASEISGAPQALPGSVLRHISPARFKK
jgi:tRNA 5-methylaminomethyl-2-thiouridine biosynthesis bifunctional protein